MTSEIDYHALRKRTLGVGSDEAVTVNTRALIDKVLARYSGEWTTLRELLQNAADASSKNVKVVLETLPSARVPVPQNADDTERIRHVISHHTLSSMRVVNDGEVFRSTDWARLKKIAEGNPDETKIGAFGVGFYSVFADSDEPFVSSGRDALAFFWKGDSLFTRSLTLPDGQSSQTTFVLPYRNRDNPVPGLFSLARFLSSSLTFVGLEGIELWLDEWNLLNLKKKIAPNMEVPIPKEMNRKTKDGLMSVSAIVKEAAQLDARWLKAIEWLPKATSSNSQITSTKVPSQTQSLRNLFHKLAPGNSSNSTAEKLAKQEKERQDKISEDLLGSSTATVFVHVNKASVKTSTNPAFAAELERATKKPPPRTLTVALLSASHDESHASSSTPAEGSQGIFDAFAPTNGKGRIFIGFTTQQTTGLNVHMSTPSVIPTVEREAIDLNNRFIRFWNVEILRVAGIVARVAWGEEMNTIQRNMTSKLSREGQRAVNRKDVASVEAHAAFLHNNYSWSESTPSSEVGSLIEEAFWTCNQKTPITILSTRGVLPANKIRLEQDDLDFIDGIPTLPPSLKSTQIIKKLIEYGIISKVTVADIRSELESKALSADQLRRFLGWVLQNVRLNEMDQPTARALLDATIANDTEDGASKMVVLSDMKGFLNPSRIPADMPIPPWIIPFKYTKDISKAVLELLFDDLQMVPWLRWIIENTGGRGDLSKEQDFTRLPAFATSVLLVISKQWDGLSQSSKATVIELLSSRTIMPTKLGMRKPSEAYFPSVKLFDDLPVVTGLHSAKDKFLSAVGVRKTIEIGVVLDRLMMDGPGTSKPDDAVKVNKWSHVDLIKYLASVQRDIPSEDIDRLRKTKICPAEGGTERFLVSDLHRPDPKVKELSLPVLQWPGVYRPESSEGRFLQLLGLKSYPSARDILHLATSAHGKGNHSLREHALRYYVDHHQINGYSRQDVARISEAFLPVQGSEVVAAPGDVFVNERAATLGFKILRRDLQIHALKFGVQQDPPLTDCIDQLIRTPPETKPRARAVFGYFASRISEFNSQYVSLLGHSKIVPVLRNPSSSREKDDETRNIVHTTPQACFLGYGDSKYAVIFDYVDFGQEGNSFLLSVGSKHEPSITELCQRLIQEPARLFSVLGDAKYLELLRSIADSWSTIKRDKAIIKEMRSSKCLLAYKEMAGSTPAEDEEEEEAAVKSWELAKSSDIVVVDDIIAYHIFRESLLAAPMEEPLERMYLSLGSPSVASLLEERQSIGNLERDQNVAIQLQKLIHERIRLFLHDYSPDEIKRGHQWVQKNVLVQRVSSLSLTLSLRGYNVRRRLSKHAVLFNDKPILFITPNFNMLEISQALAPLLLNRVKPQSVFMLEMMLESSLAKLRSRGYNVQRIMNEKAKEAKVAEERRKQQEAEEQRKIQEREAAWAQAQAEEVARAKEQQMPGVFPELPDRSKDSPKPPSLGELDIPKAKGLLSGISKQFGFDNIRRQLSQMPPKEPVETAGRAIETPPEHDDQPPPYSVKDQQTQPSRPTPLQPEPVTAPHQVQQNLLNLIQDSRSHNSSVVQSAPNYNDVKETSSYCDAQKSQNLTAIGETPNGNIRIFMDRTAETSGAIPSAAGFMQTHASGLKTFASILLACADSFALKRDALHIFWDAGGTTVAFNTNKALFFNYRYFESLHLRAISASQQPAGSSNSGGGGGSSSARAEAIAYWSVTMAHELAHNLVSTHSAQHSYYTESLIAQYFDRIAANCHA